MYSLVWQSVMWRPGKLLFLIGVKNPLPIRWAGTARKHRPLRGRAGRQILILIDASFSSRLSRSKLTTIQPSARQRYKEWQLRRCI
jgi:hypothetical protein